MQRTARHDYVTMTSSTTHLTALLRPVALTIQTTLSTRPVVTCYYYLQQSRYVFVFDFLTVGLSVSGITRTAAYTFLWYLGNSRGGMLGHRLLGLTTGNNPISLLRDYLWIWARMRLKELLCYHGVLYHSPDIATSPS